MDDKDPWAEILTAALKLASEESSAPFLGAQFRHHVAKAAAERGMTFPPTSEPRLRLGELLQRYPSIVASLARPSQDILVAPAEHPELLTHQQNKGSLTGIRSDFFSAFTRINPQRKPWYDPALDAVAWLESEPEADKLIPIPSPSLEDELAVRRGFAEQAGDERKSQLLLDALSATQPLAAYTAIVRAENLQRRWHLFRTEALAERIRDWTRHFGLEWQDHWLTSAMGATPISERAGPWEKHDDRKDAPPTERFLKAISRLSADEISRISVPLDVVLKLLS